MLQEYRCTVSENCTLINLACPPVGFLISCHVNLKFLKTKVDLLGTSFTDDSFEEGLFRKNECSLLKEEVPSM